MNVFDEKNFDAKLYEAAVRWMWRRYQMTLLPVVLIVFGMALAPELTFEEVLEAWCSEGCKLFDYPAEPVPRMRSHLCEYLLRKGHDIPGGLGAWFKSRAEEVRAFADGVSSAA